MRTQAAAVSLFCLAIGFAAPAEAQYGVRGQSNRATGENYHFEIGGHFWSPGPEGLIQSESLGIIGSEINLVSDLGFEKTRFGQIRMVGRPAKKHKFRFEYIPIGYLAESVFQRDLVFNGIRFHAAVPVRTEMKWNAYRFGYEWDFIYRERGFLGVLLEAKYTDIQATLTNAFDTEWARARAPIPAIGVVGRVYPTSNFSIHGELSGFKLPESIDERYRARYVDFDLYGTYNFNDHVGAQFGYRSLDLFYSFDGDSGNMTMKGLYFGGVARF